MGALGDLSEMTDSMPGAGLEPARRLSPVGSKPTAFANFATPAKNKTHQQRAFQAVAAGES